MAKQYSRLDSIRIVREARKSKDISGLLKNYGLAQRDLKRMQEEYGSVERDKFIVPGGSKPKTIGDYYSQNLHHFQHVSVDYD